MKPNLNLTEGSILRGLSTLAAPMLVGALLQNLQSLIDLFWVGGLGKEAVAAVAMSGTILMVLFPMLMGVSTGTVALVARAAGGRRFDEASAATGQSLIISLVLGVVFGAIGWFLSDTMFWLLGASPAVAELGASYLRISLLGIFTAFTLFILSAALQGAGDARTPMYVMGLANVLNMGLDPLFIFGWGPVPRMGVAGAALATVLSQAVAAGIVAHILFGARSHLHVRWAHLKLHAALAWRILRIGIPGAGQMLARSLMGLVLMRLVATCEALEPARTAAPAAYGVGMRIHMVILMPAFALGGAAATMVGHNLGAGEPARARHAAWLATAIDVLFMAGAATLMMALAPQIISIFNRDPMVVEIGSHYLRVVSPFYIFAALGIVLGRALNGAGDSMGPMIITVVTLWGLQVPLAIYFSHIWQPATQGIWWAMSAAMLVQGLLVMAWFEMGRWKRIRV